MLAQILNQMPSVYENKVDYVKHLIDSGTELTLVDVVGHLRETFCPRRKKILWIQEHPITRRH